MDDIVAPANQKQGYGEGIDGSGSSITPPLPLSGKSNTIRAGSGSTSLPRAAAANDDASLTAERRKDTTSWAYSSRNDCSDVICSEPEDGAETRSTYYDSSYSLGITTEDHFLGVINRARSIRPDESKIFGTPT